MDAVSGEKCGQGAGNGRAGERCLRLGGKKPLLRWSVQEYLRLCLSIGSKYNYEDPFPAEHNMC